MGPFKDSLDSATHLAYLKKVNIKNLYQKVADFEAKENEEAKAFSQCRAGCSRCCYVDLSVFGVEAKNIEDWFSSLSLEKKSELRQLWLKPQTQTKSFSGEDVTSCAFLVDEKCTIYEARPLICRTQGMALKFKNHESEYVDICPLNEEMLNLLASSEIINLDLLNSILVQLEKIRGETKRVQLSTLKQKFQKEEST